MIKEIIDVLKGCVVWQKLKHKEHIDYTKIVLVLTGENKEVDYYSLVHLNDVIERKHAKTVIIITDKYEIVDEVHKFKGCKYPIKIRILKSKHIDCIYKWYSIDKFFYNIFFTYTDKTKNNLLGRFLRETDINAEDVVCLAIYNLRQIPKEVNTNNV